ncbi:MAG: phosphocarrier protein HPr [Candidatus Muproteobacteria bacterium RIFCSPHIGHO2_01_FULL_65_16]|uniref:Phosphocarrier protein HPr n=3 Tax=Candidatus Muproteobacteria TaxID=1817795 RepID=A0A1F6TA86_9PROT|nr:MAG: phosphocarrier protein HPr [Candidatus Muproteobacteria bacterium RBG_16_65_31]OGI45098.1 MAG: phosphocarrier protein HPr [Candidatus Muproteobacteria bacterium RIFCSPHIGHO2_01_FULL_65_16]OGI50741.1 MAG: phosphocarrier protein HPr [Candidatus Muproteobacteria bacterium RIFCSPHIGHO2_02_FULL_65_16]
MRCQKVVIRNKLGMHARASAKFVSLASGFKSEITLKRNGQQVNGKSIMGIMMLAAAKGSELELCAKGQDEAKAVATLADLIADRFGEDE